MTKIAIWNVNSIKARKDHVIQWLKQSNCDILMIQELKMATDAVPVEAFESIGYHTQIHGQKTYNGVAIFSKAPLRRIRDSLLDGDEQARYLECETDNGIRVINIYAPNGNPVESEKYPYKLKWLDQLIERAGELMRDQIPFLIGGDYNIIPTALDMATPSEWRKDALHLPESVEKYRILCGMGLYDAFRTLHPDQGGHYSFWDYQAGCWQRDNGIRIDHFLCSPEIMDRVNACTIDRTPRGWEKPSDHTAVILELQ